MEEDNFKPDCDNIRKNIKAFSDDMLKDDEYKEFLNHLETCSECDKYVRSFDSFSNQLWGLGEVKVPSDFASTVLFKATQPEAVTAAPEQEESTSSKKWLIGGIAFILVGITLAAGIISYFKLREPAAPQVTAVEPAPETAPLAQEEVSYNTQEQAETEEPAVFDWGGKLGQNEAAVAPEAPTGPQLVHWHYLYYDKSKELETLRFRRKKRQVESDLRNANSQKEQLTPGSEEAAQLDGQIRTLESDLAEVDAKLELNAKNKKIREEGPVNVLQSLDIRPDYKDNDFVFLSTDGNMLKLALDGFDKMIEGEKLLEDFTPGMSHLPHKQYKVSIYLLKQETNVLHWHVPVSMESQATQFIKTVQDNGGVITYDFAEEVTFSVPSGNIDNIKQQMPAMRINLYEYGNPVIFQDEESGGKTVLSVFFPPKDF